MDKKIHGRFIRPTQYARELGISLRTLRNWLADGRLPHLKVGRVVLIDPRKADAALEKFQRVEVGQ